jgi:hypothetical protein
VVPSITPSAQLALAASFTGVGLHERILLPDLPGLQISQFEQPLATGGLAGRVMTGRRHATSASGVSTWGGRREAPAQGFAD